MQDISIKHINICLNKIGDDHLTLAVYKFADKCQENGIDVVFCVLNKSISKHSKDYCFFDFADKYSDSGIYIATCTNTANLLKQMCGQNINIFYLWELEWLNKDNFIFEDEIEKYILDDFAYWVRSYSHQSILNHIWNVKGTIVDDFDYDTIIQMIIEEIKND